MTTPELIDDLTSQRLTRELRAAARQVDLTPGSELAVVTRGRRRQHRRRRAMVLASVVALGGVTVVAVQQLAGTGEQSIATDDPSTVDGAPDESTLPATTAGFEAVSPDMQLAQVVESNMVWNLVEPDSTEAVAYATLGDRFPAIALATAPGRSDQYTPQFWQTDDGVTFTPLDIEIPVGAAHSARVDGDTIYAVGTAPGISEQQPNPVFVMESTDRGATWDGIELPVDVNANRMLPFVQSVASSVEAYPLEGGVVVLVHNAAQLDQQEIANRLTPSTGVLDGMQMAVEGVYSLADPSCRPKFEQLSPVAGPIETVAPDRSEGFDTYGGCARVLTEWNTIGVPDESVAAAFDRPVRAFRVVDGIATELDVPADLFGTAGGSIESPLFLSTDDFGATQQYYTLDAVGNIVATDAPAGLPGWPTDANSTTQFAALAGALSGAFDSGAATGFGASTDGGATWQYADWRSLYGSDRTASPMASAVTEAGIVTVDRVMPDPIAASGGVTVSNGGYTISRTTSRDAITVVDDATRERVPLERVMLSDNRLVITDGAGGELASLAIEAFGPVLYPDWMGDVGDHEYFVSTSADGVHVAVEPLADLLEVDDDQISSVPRISAVGDTTVIAVTLNDRNDDGTNRQLVLVGTPRL